VLTTFPSASLARRLKKDYTFSGGLVIPAENDIFSPSSPALFDDTEYSNPKVFDGFRYYRMKQKVGRSESHRLVSTSPTDLNFGDGRHVW
jgi:cytochrome P450 monooxygenase